MIVSEGAEARIFSARAFGKELLVKIRGKKDYRIGQLDLAIRRWRTKNEARIMRTAYSLGLPVPRIVALGEFSIYMERVDGKPMKDSRAHPDEVLKCGEILAVMHNNGIVHGDFTPANIMLSDGDISVIDFGLAEFSKDAEEKALDVLLMKRSISTGLYKHFRNGYFRESKNPKQIMERLAEIELRGRYQSRTLD